MISRRAFLASSAALSCVRGAGGLTSRERVDRALAGKDVDRPPFTFWYHFLDEKAPGAQHAASTLAFHRKFQTDIVKVMSDYPYPRGGAEWFALRPVENPFPAQMEALRRINDELKGSAYFVETIFNPVNVAEKLSSKAAVGKLKAENPAKLRAALEAIAQSEANHARRAVQAGAAGIFLAIANSADPDYAAWSEPYDKRVLDAVRDAPLNVLHIHGDKIDLPRFFTGWPAAAINYSGRGTGIAFAEARKSWRGVLMGGVDEVRFRELTADEVREQVKRSRAEAGAKYIAAGGCSVPNETADEELLRAVRALGA